MAACLGLAVIGATVAFVAWWRRLVWLLIAAAAIVFAAGGVRLASTAWQRAWRPPLRVVFEALAREDRAQATIEGRHLPEDDEAFAIVEGVLRADAALTTNGVSLSLEVDSIEAPTGQADGSRSLQASEGGAILTVTGALAADHVADWRAGRRVRMPVRLHRPSRYFDPGVPDFERALARRGTTLVGTVKSGALVEVLTRGSRMAEGLAATRAEARRVIAASVGRWDVQSAAIVAAIVIGDRSALDPDVERRLQEAGTYHVIAISGGNIAILSGLLLAGFRIAGWLGRSAMLSAAALLVAYGQLVGGGASVDRATLMAVLYFGSRALDHRSPPLNTLAVASGVLIVADPLSVADPAFILTFGATLAILLVPWRPVSGPRMLGATLSMLIASLAVEALLFPVAALVFSRVTFAGLGLNLLAVPLMAVAQIAGMLVVPAYLVSPVLAMTIGWIAHVGAAGLVRSADLVAFAPAFAYRVAAPSPWVCILYYCGAAAAWLSWRRRAEVTGSAEPRTMRVVRIVASTAASGAALWILVDPIALAGRTGDGRLHVTFVDVGQGDAAFVRFPHGSTMVVDTGGSAGSSFDIGDRVVAPVLRIAGVGRLDVLALTHGDPDHIGGAPALVREFRPREVWEGVPVPRLDSLTALRVAAQAAGARWANVHRGDRVTIDGIEIVAHHPDREDWERQKVRNDDSLVLELRWRDVSIVMTGDIGRGPEHEWIARGIPQARLRVVKVPHHGSLTSSSPEFVAALRPTIAVVSAGRANHFGHPVPEVLQRYALAGATVFRTDRDGAVTVDTDGTTLGINSATLHAITVTSAIVDDGRRRH